MGQKQRIHVEGSAVGVLGCAEAQDLPQEGSAGGLADTNTREHMSSIVTNPFIISSVILEWLKVTGYSQHKDNGYSN